MVEGVWTYFYYYDIKNYIYGKVLVETNKISLNVCTRAFGLVDNHPLIQ